MFNNKTDNMKLDQDTNKGGVGDGDFQKYLSEENISRAKDGSGAKDSSLQDSEGSFPGEKTEKLDDSVTGNKEDEVISAEASAASFDKEAGAVTSEALSADDAEKVAAEEAQKKSAEAASGSSEPSAVQNSNSEKRNSEKENSLNIQSENPDGSNPVKDLKEPGKGSKKRRKKKKKRTKWFWIHLVIIIAAIIALLTGGLFYAFYYGAGLVQMQRVDSKTFGDELYINDWVSSNKDMDGYTNIALFGVDSRDDDLLSGDNRSDIIMIVSIRNRTGKVKVVSLYRDTYINVGYGEYDKANTAYAYGGPMQAVNMLNMNLDLNITDFATFGFKGVIDAIDELGGVDIDVQEEEIEYINMYLQTMQDEIGSENNPITQAGMQHLDGAQATAYARIRYTQGGDFHRTERQRAVLQQIFQKASDCSPRTLINVCNSLSDEVATSLSNTEIMELIVKMLYMKIDDTAGFPIEEYREPATLRGRSIVIPTTLADNVKWLHGYLFGEEPYYTSELVDEISDMIDRKTTYAIADDDPILQDMKEDDSAGEYSTAEPSVDLGNTGNTAQTSEETYTADE